MDEVISAIPSRVSHDFGGAIRSHGSRRRISLTATILAVAFAGWVGGCSQATTHAGTDPAPMSVSYIGSWGVKGDGPGQLDQPTCIATDTVGNAYLADAGSHFVEKFDAQGTPLLAFQEESVKHPQAITVDSGGAIYVTDSGRGSALVFFPEGDRIKEIRLKKRPNAEDMLGIAVDDDGMIHILDADAGRVFTYTPRFRLLNTWQPAANVPNDRARARSMADGPDGYLYLTDLGGNRILRFTSDGHFEAEMGAAEAGWRLSDQFAVTRGYIFAMDADGRMLHVLTIDGQPKLDVDLAPELGQAKRSAPALAISSRKELLVLDAPEARVLRYRLNF